MDFGRIWEAKTEAKIDCWEVFFRCFFRLRFGIDFEWIFGGSEPEKSIKTMVFSMVFANFHKIDVFEKMRKNLDFGVVFGGQSEEKSRTNCVEKHTFFLHRFFCDFLRFLMIFARFWQARGPQKIEKKLKKSQKIAKNRFFNAFSFEGGFWEGSGTVSGGFLMDVGSILELF